MYDNCIINMYNYIQKYAMILFVAVYNTTVTCIFIIYNNIQLNYTYINICYMHCICSLYMYVYEHNVFKSFEMIFFSYSECFLCCEEKVKNNFNLKFKMSDYAKRITKFEMLWLKD